MNKLIGLLLIFIGIIEETHAQRNLRLLSYNIRNAKGMDNKTDYDRTASVIKNVNANVIALQELDSVTIRSSVDVLKILAQKTGYHFVYGAAIHYQGGRYGVGVLSREKPLRWYTVPLPGREEERILLVAVFRKYVIFCTHWSLTEADRLISADIVNREAEKFSLPIYLLGDMNAEPNSEAIGILKQKWSLLSGEDPTFPAPVPVKCIDYIFGINSKLKVINRAVLQEQLTSDHRPVLVELRR